MKVDSIKIKFTRLKRRLKVRAKLVEMYNLCCEKIKEADDMGLTDIIFELPTSMFLINTDCVDIEIIKYIDNNLRKQKLNTYVVNSKKLFITWKFLELNKEIQKLYNYCGLDNSKK